MASVDVILSIEGGNELVKALKKKPREFLALLAQRLPAEGQALMNAANAAAPRRTGTLAGSSVVTSVVQEAKGVVRVAAAYTDEKAAAVHEGVHWGEHVEGTNGFKWFERATSKFEQGFVDRVAQDLKQLTGGGE
jgi:hypothetical protein